MTRNKANQLAHEPLIKLHLLCTFVQRATLCHIPFGQKVHHIVVPADVTLHNFTTSWVNNARTVCVFLLWRQITQERIACVVGTDVAAFGHLFAHNGILKSCGFKCFVPVIDALNEIRHPLFWRGRVDIINDLLLGFDEFAARISLFILRNQAITRNDGIVLAGLSVAECHQTLVEITHTFVG